MGGGSSTASCRRAFRIFVKRRRLERRLRTESGCGVAAGGDARVIARKLVAVWYRKLVIVTIKWQARIRRALCQLHLKRRWIQERRLYVVIHSAVRMFLGKCRVQRQRGTACAGTSNLYGEGRARGASPTGRGWNP